MLIPLFGHWSDCCQTCSSADPCQKLLSEKQNQMRKRNICTNVCVNLIQEILVDCVDSRSTSMMDITLPLENASVHI